MREFESLATVHGDQRDGVGACFLFFLAFAVERDFFEEGFEAFHPGPGQIRRGAIHRGHKVLEIADAALGGFGIFLGATKFVEVADLVQEFVGPKLERELFGV